MISSPDAIFMARDKAFFFPDSEEVTPLSATIKI